MWRGIITCTTFIDHLTLHYSTTEIHHVVVANTMKCTGVAAPCIPILHVLVLNLLRATLSTVDERTGDEVRYYVGHFGLQRNIGPLMH